MLLLVMQRRVDGMVGMDRVRRWEGILAINGLAYERQQK